MVDAAGGAMAVAISCRLYRNAATAISLSSLTLLSLQLWERCLHQGLAGKRTCIWMGAGQELSVDAVYEECLVQRFDPCLACCSQTSLQHPCKHQIGGRKSPGQQGLLTNRRMSQM